ncbi:MAG: OmpH family outer membrane protein [Xanthomonadales bacterium]|nr:OmpH family outer membrane protein [Xanthomonadales bacterium]
MAQQAQPARILALLFAALALFAGPAPAEPPVPLRIGYVDMKRLLDNAPQVVAGRRTLEREFASRDATLQEDEKRAAALRTRKTGAAGAEADALQRELDALERSIRRNREALRAELKTRSDQELDRSWREINDAVVEFAREQGYDLIVPSPVIYASPKVDVTERILERLRREAAAKSP